LAALCGNAAASAWVPINFADAASVIALASGLAVGPLAVERADVFATCCFARVDLFRADEELLLRWAMATSAAEDRMKMR
jgi:hypothetical protein